MQTSWVPSGSSGVSKATPGPGVSRLGQSSLAGLHIEVKLVFTLSPSSSHSIIGTHQ